MKPQAQMVQFTLPTPPVKEEIPKVALTVEEAAKALSLGKTKTYALVEEKKLGSVRAGRKIIIPVIELHRYLSREIQSQQPLIQPSEKEPG